MIVYTERSARRNAQLERMKKTTQLANITQVARMVPTGKSYRLRGLNE